MMLIRYIFIRRFEPRMPVLHYVLDCRCQTELYDSAQASRAIWGHGWTSNFEHHAHDFHHCSVCNQAHIHEHGRAINLISAASVTRDQNGFQVLIKIESNT